MYVNVSTCVSMYVRVGATSAFPSIILLVMFNFVYVTPSESITAENHVDYRWIECNYYTHIRMVYA